MDLARLLDAPVDGGGGGLMADAAVRGARERLRRRQCSAAACADDDGQSVAGIGAHLAAAAPPFAASVGRGRGRCTAPDALSDALRVDRGLRISLRLCADTVLRDLTAAARTVVATMPCRAPLRRCSAARRSLRLTREGALSHAAALALEREAGTARAAVEGRLPCRIERFSLFGFLRRQPGGEGLERGCGCPRPRAPPHGAHGGAPHRGSV